MNQYTPIGARLDIELDQELLRMQNEWFFKWHFIGRNGPVEIESFNGKPICYGGIKYSGSARNVYWVTIQRYLRMKVGSIFDALEGELEKYPVDIRDTALTEVRRLVRRFIGSIRRTAVKKDCILRGNGTEFPPEADMGRWHGARTEDVDARVNTLRHIYCRQSPAFEGNEVMFKDMMNDSVTLVKLDGTVFREKIPGQVSPSLIITFSADLPIETGDHFLRELPSGLVEDFVVLDPNFQSGGRSIKPHFQVKVRRSNEPPATPQTFIANITGDQSRVYVNSTDNSINVATGISGEQLSAFVVQVKENLSTLPAEQQAAIADQLTVLDAEAASTNPSKSKIGSALQSIKTVCEGAAGNLVAAGIIASIAKMGGG